MDKIRSLIISHLIFLLILGNQNSFAQLPGNSLLDGSSSKKINFEFVQGFIIVEARYGGVFPLKFIFDTGAQNTIIFDRLTANLFPVAYDRKIQLTGSDFSKTISATIARSLPLKFERCGMVKKDLLVLDEDILKIEEVIGIPIHGIIGADFLRGMIVKIDYRLNEITIYNPSKYNRNKLNDYIKLDAVFNDGKPYVGGKIITNNNDSVFVRLLLDTGASISSLIHNNTHPSLSLPPNSIKGHLGRGLSGTLNGFVGKIPKIKIANFTFNNAISYFQDIALDSLHNKSLLRNGIIGNFLLDRFKIIIDYTKEEVYFKAEKKIDEPFQYDRSGISVLAQGVNLKEFVVMEVLPNSPAERVGIKKDDIILSINWFGRNEMSLDKINRLLSSKAGKKIKMIVLRDNKKYKFKFKLEDLI